MQAPGLGTVEAFDALEKAIDLRATPRQVWNVLTDPTLIKQWLSDSEIEVQSEWCIGGAMVFKGDWHGFPLEDKGEIVQFEPERAYAYRYWSSLSQLPDRAENYMLIRFDLSGSQEGVRLRLRQENFRTFEIYAHWNFYWTMALYRIRNLAETGTIGRS